MSIIKLYDKKDPEEKDPKNEEGEYIIIEEVGEEDDIQDDVGDTSTLYQKMISFFVIRLFILFILCIAVLWVAYHCIIFCASTLFSLLTFFREPSFLARRNSSWAFLKFGAAALIGLLLSLLSPSLGVSMMASYFIVGLEDTTSSFFLRFLKSRFRDFES